MNKMTSLKAALHASAIGIPLFTGAAFAATHPVRLNQVTLHASERIDAWSSDIQGPIAAGEGIALRDFGIRNQADLTSRDQRGIQTSVMSGGKFKLLRGHVAMGGVSALGDIGLRDCRIDGTISTPASVERSRCGYPRVTQGNSDRTKTALESLEKTRNHFTAQLDAIYRQTEPRLIRNQPTIRRAGTVTLADFDTLPRAIALDAENQARSVFIVRVTSNQALSIEDGTVFLENGTRPENIVFYFPNTPNITLIRTGSRMDGKDIGFPGMLLAPDAHLKAGATLITGSVFVRTFSGLSLDQPTAQINSAPFTGRLIPEPPAGSIPSAR
jgi:choice-of-anchor A domain-containing protein